MSLSARLTAIESRLYGPLRARADARRATPRPAHLILGERGEDEAYFHLRALGYTVVARRWRSARLRGDLDLVAWDGDTLVIVEVKTRTSSRFAPAELAVDRDKRNELRRHAAAYLRRIPAPYRDAVPVRFDILAVYLSPEGRRFEHFPAQFPFHAPREDRPRFI